MSVKGGDDKRRLQLFHSLPPLKLPMMPLVFPEMYSSLSSSLNTAPYAAEPSDCSYFQSKMRRFNEEKQTIER